MPLKAVSNGWLARQNSEKVGHLFWSGQGNGVHSKNFCHTSSSGGWDYTALLKILPSMSPAADGQLNFKTVVQPKLGTL
jgi:hypothetical protein